MNKQTIKKFVSAWKKEYAASTSANKLDSQLESAMLSGRATKSIENKIATQKRKAQEAMQIIIDMMIDDEIGEDAVKDCGTALDQDLSGYVSDCYGYLYMDKDFYVHKAGNGQ